MAERQAALIAQWMNVGFIHGVMNTDNMTISGETIDYGPCAFMEAYDPAAVFSSIDHQGRYAFGNQPDIACWNLARLAETLLPLLSDDPEQAVAMATEVHRCVPGAVPQAPARADSAPSSGCVEPTRTTTRPIRRWSTTGWRCCMPSAWISRSPGGGSPTPRPATKRRCARCSPMRTRPMHGWPAGERAARARATAHSMARQFAGHRARQGDAQRQSLSSSRATIASRRRLPPRPTQGDLAPFRRLLAAVRQPYDENA